jgi:hypothetical protein
MAALVFVVAFCMVAVLVYMARYSGRLHVTQTRIIDAAVDDVYSRVADLRQWHEWNPWLAHEPDARATLEGTVDGEGGRCVWQGARIGSGMVEHLRLQRGLRIEQRMHFQQPFRVRGRGLWQFTDRAGKTEVTWSMTGRVAFPLRAFAATVQGMIALDHRYGLDRLAALVEPAEASRYSLTYLGVRAIPAGRYVYRTYDGPLKGLGAALRAGFRDLRLELAGAGMQASGAAIAIYVRTNIKLRTTLCHMAIPCPGGDPGRLPVRDLQAHDAYVVRLQGSHAALEVAWYQAMQRMRIEGIQPDQRIPPFERYASDPGTVSENDQFTELNIPVRPPG